MKRGKVVIRHGGPILGKWWICHADSYQCAMGSKANGFADREDAIKTAWDIGFEVEHHAHDQMQQAS